MKYLLATTLLTSCQFILAQETITITAVDGLEITADLYQKHSDAAPFIILFHQAGWSRGEYLEIAPKLNELGYNCLAVDLRSEGKINGISNQTASRAKKAGKKTSYWDAFPDIEAVVKYVKQSFKSERLIIWGSSYSSALVLKYAGDNPNDVDAVLAFAPGEYFKPEGFIHSSAKNITCPSFITSAKSEKSNWWKIHEVIQTSTKGFYVPATSGNHGSRALWGKFSDNEGYWKGVKEFLEGI
ncbi:MAG: alpha/beta fold hydrolase [Cytophagales bacterium]|nr:alpha/beta fold hydrolase [Cytophagales bacterium]